MYAIRSYYGFDLGVSQQRIESLDASLALRFQYVFTPRFGVAIPYLNLAAHRELKDNARTITTGFAAVSDILGTNTFAVPTDFPDSVITSYSIHYTKLYDDIGQDICRRYQGPGIWAVDQSRAFAPQLKGRVVAHRSIRHNQRIIRQAA